MPVHTALSDQLSLPVIGFRKFLRHINTSYIWAVITSLLETAGVPENQIQPQR
jgi:hypothetical protein